MRLAIMQAYFFPYLGYFQLINAVDKFILYENLSFRKESWMTRNRILAKKAHPFYIYVPVKSKSSNKIISEINIANEINWKTTLKKNIHYNYNHCKYYDEIMPVLEKIIDTDTDKLHVYNSLIICKIAGLLGITAKIDFENTTYLDLEEQLQLKYTTDDQEAAFNSMERKTERIFCIAKEEKATIFINAIGGNTLYSKTEFAKSELTLNFLRTKDYFYHQQGIEFFRDLSIIDVLLNCGIDGTKELLNNFELI